MEPRTIKRIALASVIGVVFGGLAGFGFGKITEFTPPVEPAEFGTLQEHVDARPLQAQCIRDEGVLEVVLYWSLPDDVQKNELFRSSGGGAPARITDSGGTSAVFSTFIDSSVEDGKTYTYYFETDEDVVSNTFEVRVSQTDCNDPS